MSEPILCDKCEEPIEGDHFTPTLQWQPPIVLHLHWGCGNEFVDVVKDNELGISFYGSKADGDRFPTWVWEMLERIARRADAPSAVAGNLKEQREAADSPHPESWFFPAALQE